MEINFNPEIGRIGARSEVRPKTAAKPASDVSFPEAEALDQAVGALPEVRPEAVARGAQLVASAHYPPLEMMQKLACLLAVSSEESE